MSLLVLAEKSVELSAVDLHFQIHRETHCMSSDSGFKIQLGFSCLFEIMNYQVSNHGGS